jgi:hypothetical protein
MKRDFKELGSEDVDWTFLAHDMDQLRTTSNSVYEPSLSRKGDGISSIFSRRIPLMLYTIHTSAHLKLAIRSQNIQCYIFNDNVAVLTDIFTQ